ncbi:hypothetical protein CTI12_AA217790 [Artemisia annua]|uniref:CPR5 protein n=1 Tax=Artemisia annua TaxID=35608 RepID=A0A2U1NXE1_ARTAN|nr:hypothetical protein CTI12_AA217790 [Artemisia annua]
MEQPPTTTVNCGESIDHQNKPNPTSIKTMKKNKKKKNNKDVVSSDESSCSNVMSSRSKGVRIAMNRRNLNRIGKKGGEVDALALPLGMSIAAFVAQVLERKNANGEKMSVDHLSEICTLAVKESLSNVFGDKFDCFVSNFERSFQSTLMTLRVISETSGNRERSYLHGEGSSTCNSSDFHFDMKENTSTGQEQPTIVNLDDDNVYKNPIYNEVAVHQDPINSRQLARVAPNRLHSGVNNGSMLTTFEKSVNEQARSNDLKALEISLSMKKMRLKEAQIAVNCDSNYLERFKLSMGISKANFRANKFKTELQDSRHAQLLKNCADCLVAGLLIMLSCLTYGTYIHSHQRLIDATESCMPTKETSSWWMPKPMSSFSSGFQILRCQVQVISQMLFGALMIVALTYLLIQRSGTTNQTMPITFLLLLLGVGCGFAGKFCIDTLGGSGNHWLFYWEFLCLVHFFANVCTSMLFVILHGPVTVTGGSMGHMLFPYWVRRLAFYAIVLVYLPLLCGLMPFAGPGEWLEHFSGLVVGRVDE